MDGAEIDIALKGGSSGRVAWVTVQNPARLNILDSNGFDALSEAFESLAKDDNLRLAVLTGDGDKAFIGGADIGEMIKLGPALARSFINRLCRTTASIRALPVPVIARIDGYTLGAGLEIAVCCDLRAASDRSTFGMPEVRVGIPSVIEAVLLPRLIGWGRTCELVLTGETISAEEALEWGLIERLTTVEALDATIERWIDAVLNSGPRAIRLQKSIMKTWESEPVGESIRASIETFTNAFDSDEPRRLMQKFLDRRRH